MKERTIKFSILFFALLATNTLYAKTQPKFIIVPQTPGANEVNVAINEVTAINYQVTNNTQTTRLLTMRALGTGITQLTAGAGVCSNPFSLAPNQSCLLRLQIAGNLFKKMDGSGPEVCKTVSNNDNRPDAFLCSGPTVANLLRVTILPAKTATISLLNSPLGLTAGGSDSALIISNDSSTVTATNIAATLPPALLAVLTPSGNTCSSVPPGGTCQLSYTPPANTSTYIFGTTFPIQGDNTSSITGMIFIKPPLLSVIGDATPGGWFEDTDMTYDSLSKLFSVTLHLNPGVYKFRQNHNWGVTFGGNGGPCPTGLIEGIIADNLTFSGPSGSHTLTVDYATGTCGIY